MTGLRVRNLRWWIVALICAGTIANYLARNSLGVLAPELKSALHMSTQQYSYVVGAFQLCYTIMQPVAGRSSTASACVPGSRCSVSPGRRRT